MMATLIVFITWSSIPEANRELFLYWPPNRIFKGKGTAQREFWKQVYSKIVAAYIEKAQDVDAHETGRYKASSSFYY